MAVAQERVERVLRALPENMREGPVYDKKDKTQTWQELLVESVQEPPSG